MERHLSGARKGRMVGPNVTDDELEILKDLWDRTKRFESNISLRTGLSPEQVIECLKALEAKSFVQRREKLGQWRITPDGEAYIHSYQKPWYERPSGLVIVGLIVAVLGGVISGVIVATLAGA